MNISGREHMTSEYEAALLKICEAEANVVHQYLTPTQVKQVASALKSRLLSPAIGAERLAEIQKDAKLIIGPHAFFNTADARRVIAELLSALTASPAQKASNTDDLCAALLSDSPATETVTREELEDYLVYWTSGPRSLAQNLLSQFNITRKVQP